MVSNEAHLHWILTKKFACKKIKNFNELAWLSFSDKAEAYSEPY